MWQTRARIAPRLVLLRGLQRLDGIEAVNRDLASRTQHVAEVLRAFGATVGPRAVVHGPLILHNAAKDYRHLDVGPIAHIGRGVLLDLTAPLHIGQGATVSMGSTLLTHADVGDRPLADVMPRRVASTVIGAGAYLGANVTVLAGCNIGERAVVAAGAVVTRSVPAGARVGGVPARPLDREAIS